MANGERILIAGAGTGGLTAGIALVRAGFDVVVVERATELCAVGAGITVQANAVVHHGGRVSYGNATKM